MSAPNSDRHNSQDPQETEGHGQQGRSNTETTMDESRHSVSLEILERPHEIDDDDDDDAGNVHEEWRSHQRRASANLAANSNNSNHDSGDIGLSERGMSESLHAHPRPALRGILTNASSHQQQQQPAVAAAEYSRRRSSLASSSISSHSGYNNNNTADSEPPQQPPPRRDRRSISFSPFIVVLDRDESIRSISVAGDEASSQQHHYHHHQEEEVDYDELDHEDDEEDYTEEGTEDLDGDYEDFEDAAEEEASLELQDIIEEEEVYQPHPPQNPPEQQQQSQQQHFVPPHQEHQPLQLPLSPQQQQQLHPLELHSQQQRYPQELPAPDPYARTIPYGGDRDNMSTTSSLTAFTMDLSGRMSLTNDETHHHTDHNNNDDDVNNNNTAVHQGYAMATAPIDIESSSVSGSESSYYDAHDGRAATAGAVAALAWGKNKRKMGQGDDDLGEESHSGNSPIIMGEHSISTFGDERVSIDHTLEKDVEQQVRRGRRGLFVALTAVAHRVFRGRATPAANAVLAEGAVDDEDASVHSSASSSSSSDNGAALVFGPAHVA